MAAGGKRIFLSWIAYIACLFFNNFSCLDFFFPGLITQLRCLIFSNLIFFSITLTNSKRY